VRLDGGRGLFVSGIQDALGHVHYAVGALADLVEALEEPLDPVLEPFDRITTRVDVRRVVWAAVSAGRLGGARGSRRARRPRGLVAAAPAVLVWTGLVGEFFCLAGRLLGGVSGFLRRVGCFLGRVGLPFGELGPPASLFGHGSGLVGPLQGSVGLQVVRPLLGPLGGFLGQIGGLFGRAGGLFRAFGALSCPLGAVARLVGQAPGLVGRLPGIELGVVEIGVVEIGVVEIGVVEIGVVEIGFSGRAGGLVVIVEARLVHGGTVVLLLDGAPGHAIGLAGLGHALAGSGLPGLVLSHDHFFPTGLPAPARHGERS
jgi:hypothetical protein